MPADEAEVLGVLRTHAEERIRPIGSLHAWSEVAATGGIAVDMRRINHVRVEFDEDGAPTRVHVGAGCTIKRLLAEMHRQGRATLPSLGLIAQQTVAGATATGTHGSGRHSMSQHVLAARVATFDAQTNEPTIRIVSAGAELEAVRCSLGLLGVITELTLLARPQYNVLETFRRYESLAPVLAAEAAHPIQQFYLVPWTWRFYAQHRSETADTRSGSAPLYRAYWIVVLDTGMHLLILFLLRVLKSPRLLRGFFRKLVAWFVPTGWAVVDRSDRQLIMNHHWFRHVEIELFVEREQLEGALDFTADVLRFLGGEALSPGAAEILEQWGALEPARRMQGQYTHHYPICVRRVLPDQTLISMSSGAVEARYAISLISYEAPDAREPFMALAGLLSDVMGNAFSARPHWGKVCPLDRVDAERLYPRLSEFRELVHGFDPSGRFRNPWTERVLGLD